MEKYAITFTDIALKNLRKIPQKNQKIILINIELLAENPFTKTNVKKLVDFDISYRMRVGNYRVLFERVDNQNRYTRTYTLDEVKKELAINIDR